MSRKSSFLLTFRGSIWFPLAEDSSHHARGRSSSAGTMPTLTGPETDLAHAKHLVDLGLAVDYGALLAAFIWSLVLKLGRAPRKLSCALKDRNISSQFVLCFIEFLEKKLLWYETFVWMSVPVILTLEVTGLVIILPAPSCFSRPEKHCPMTEIIGCHTPITNPSCFAKGVIERIWNLKFEMKLKFVHLKILLYNLLTKNFSNRNLL